MTESDYATARPKQQEANAHLKAGAVEQALGRYAEACRLDSTNTSA